jgi:SAM-dependent methyltransferase
MPRIEKPGEGILSWKDELEQDWNEGLLKTPRDCNRFLAFLIPKAGETLLDVGCGAGILLSEAVQLGLRAHGLEASPEAAAISQKTAGRAQVVVGSTQEIPFDAASFDLVTCLDISLYFSQPISGLQEIQRVLRPEGRAALLLPNSNYTGKYPEADLLPEGMQFSLQTWKKMLAEVGFKITRCQPDPWSLETRQAEAPNRLARLGGWLTRFFWRWLPKKFISRYLFCCVKSDPIA